MSETVRQTWQYPCVLSKHLKPAIADTENHRPLPATSLPGAVVGGYALLGDMPHYAIVVRVDESTVWVHIKDAPPRMSYVMTGVKPAPDPRTVAFGALLDLPNDAQRLEVFARFCTGCGRVLDSERPRCSCQNDE